MSVVDQETFGKDLGISLAQYQGNIVEEKPRWDNVPEYMSGISNILDIVERTAVNNPDFLSGFEAGFNDEVSRLGVSEPSLGRSLAALHENAAGNITKTISDGMQSAVRPNPGAIEAVNIIGSVIEKHGNFTLNNEALGETYLAATSTTPGSAWESMGLGLDGIDPVTN